MRKKHNGESSTQAQNEGEWVEETEEIEDIPQEEPVKLSEAEISIQTLPAPPDDDVHTFVYYGDSLPRLGLYRGFTLKATRARFSKIFGKIDARYLDKFKELPNEENK